MSSLKSDFIGLLKADFPGLKNEPLDELISENLLSPYKITLPKKVLQQGQEATEAFFSLRESANYQNDLKNEKESLGLIDPGNKSIMMSYDFHLNESNELKLIEINTNAAFLVLGQLIYKLKSIPKPIPSFDFEVLKECILEELRLQNKNIQSPSVVIMDQAPSTQKLYIEFLVCRELFKSWGWACEIRDIQEALKDPKPDFIYNRYTDFYFTNALSSNLRSSFLKKEVCFSPHPYEYFLLADKKRMSEWCDSTLKQIPNFEKQKVAIEKVLLKSWPLNEDNKEQLWSQRKSLFFKPAQDFGSKGSFKGGSISRKAYEDLVAKNSLAQEYISAPEINFSTDSGSQKFKYDLRFYAYQGRLQTVMARLYQGQATNLRTPGGGFACVEFQ